jgi:hypothetical protein
MPRGFEPIPALGGVGGLPLRLTRLGREQPMIADTLAAFITAAQAQGASLDIIDVADGQYGFDTLDLASPATRSTRVSWVTSALRPTDEASG